MNVELKLYDPKKINISHGRALNISLSVKLNINPAVLFGTVGKPQPFPNNGNPWYDRQDILSFPDQEESHAVFINMSDKKHNCVPSMR